MSEIYRCKQCGNPTRSPKELCTKGPCRGAWKRANEREAKGLSRQHDNRISVPMIGATPYVPDEEGGQP